MTSSLTILEDPTWEQVTETVLSRLTKTQDPQAIRNKVRIVLLRLQMAGLIDPPSMGRIGSVRGSLTWQLTIPHYHRVTFVFSNEYFGWVMNRPYFWVKEGPDAQTPDQVADDLIFHLSHTDFATTN